jgi:Cu+-exporting ATPase
VPDAPRSADPIKSTTPEAIRELHAIGLELVMLTGDNRRTAAAVARQLSLDAVEAEIEPAGKVAHVRKLRVEGKHVAMAAMASTTHPSSAKLKSALPWAPALTWPCKARDHPREGRPPRHCQSHPPQSRHYAEHPAEPVLRLLYNALGIPVATGVLYPFFGLLLSPIIAGAAMSLSSVSVISNALPLRTVRL